MAKVIKFLKKHYKKMIIAVAALFVILFVLTSLRCWLYNPIVDSKDDNSGKIEVIESKIKNNENKMELIDEEIDNSTTSDIDDLLNKRNRKK